jgi:hypothetical protein
MFEWAVQTPPRKECSGLANRRFAKWQPISLTSLFSVFWADSDSHSGGDSTVSHVRSRIQRAHRDCTCQWYGGDLFQVPTLPAGSELEKGNKAQMRIIKFVSEAFTDPETRYHTTEREGLAVIRCLEEVRGLVMPALDIPVMVYTDLKPRLSILDGSLAKDSPNAPRSARIDRWQVRLREYNLKFHLVPGVENKIADGLSRLPISAMEVGIAGREEDLVEALLAKEMRVGARRIIGVQRDEAEEEMRRKKAVDEKLVEVLVPEEMWAAVRDGVDMEENGV